MKRALWVTAGLAGIIAIVIAISLGVARTTEEGGREGVTTPESTTGAGGSAEPEFPHSFVNDRILESLSLDPMEWERLDALRSGFDEESRDMRAAQDALVREWEVAQTDGNAARTAELRGQILESAKPLTTLRRQYLAEWRTGLPKAEHAKLVRALREYRDGWSKRGKK